MSSHNTLQVVTGEGMFNAENVKAFMRDHHLEAAGVDYSVVAITGPQSSGKSTLMNTLVRLSAAQYCGNCLSGWTAPILPPLLCFNTVVRQLPFDDMAAASR